MPFLLDAMSKKKDLPSMPFYWGDIFKAPDVIALPKEIRDTFFICLGRMWESSPRGYLMINKRKPTDHEMASMLLMGFDVNMVNQHLNHLVNNSGVFSLTSEGIVYSRRMIKDEELRQIKAENGKKGGNPKLLGYPKVNQRVILKHETETETETVNKDVVKDVVKVKDTKKKYAENVKLTEKEYNQIITKYFNGDKKLMDLAVDKLDSAKLAKGYKYKSDAGAIRSWVAAEINEKSKTKQSKQETITEKNLANAQKVMERMGIE